MTTIGWVLVLMGFLVARSAARGRGATDVPADIGNLFTAVISGDYNAVQGVLDRTGENATAAVGGGSGSSDPADGATAPGESGPAVLARMRSLGQGKRYVLGATGPDSYDCSGLVYAAMKSLNAYSGPRFTTATWVATAKKIGATQVPTPAPGDVVLWPGHMGVVDGPDSFYSALSPQSGIKSLPMSVITKQKGATPSYWRLP